ncbi:TonB-dependent receptor plug domain-containing protein [Roseateles oligotrophus]|uniref:TonB-dependent receptor n=1 Tax=Roseateles oligotrophus TaxID=1769250 RepID=A0ABT2YIW1_9BURK|nr:TonB-dependent receptor [Roseateles oligotrophus]MCV2369942.1 TonB-dependent receptor [Roseateles oligotrophus]
MLVSSTVFAQSNPEAPPSPASAASAPKPGKSTSKAEQLDRVEVSGNASDDAARRSSTASKIIIGREEIERFGDATVGEVLKRLPGVTTGGRPGRGGDIRMRGMGGGYTQILVNGERMSPGFSLDQLPPEQVERIEVMRAPTAEYGARAVAGTINVVLREALAKRLNDLRLGLASERGQLRPNAGWTRSDKLDEQGGAYNLSVNVQQADTLDDLDTVNISRKLHTQAQSSLLTKAQTSGQRQALNLSAKLQWRLGDGETFNLQPFAVASRNSSDSHSTLTREPLPTDGSYYYDRAQSHTDNRNEMARLNTQWQKQLDDASRLDLRAGLGQAHGKGHTEQQQFRGGAGQAVREQSDHSDSRDRSWSLNGKYSHQLENEHSLVGGLEGEGTQRNQTKTCLQDGLSCRSQLEFGDELSASTQRIAAYAQDEWSVGKQWSFYAGLRGESISTKSQSAAYAVSNRSSVWTPLLHGVWKFDEKSRDQLRASLTRSYRSPNLQDLIAQPSINSQYPCPSNQPCGPNTVDHADRSGNPNLRPELATGIDLAYENYLSKGGILSVSAFVRRINDLMRNVTSLQNVGWAEVPRWVSQPQNIGKATTYGLELEAKFRLDEFFNEAWPVQLRSNLSLFRSSVDGIPGPNNKLDQQPSATANLGADYRLRSLPLSVGASINWTPANTVQQTLLTEASTSRKLVADAFALWNVNQQTSLRLSASNLAPLDYSNASFTLTPDSQVTTHSSGASYTQWALRLEIKI